MGVQSSPRCQFCGFSPCKAYICRTPWNAGDSERDRRLENLRRDVHSCDKNIEIAEANIEALETRKAIALANIEKIENEPEDDWPVGTYLIAEDGDPTHTKFFFKDDNGDWRHVTNAYGNTRLTWSAVLQETENLTVYQVETMKEQ